MVNHPNRARSKKAAAASSVSAISSTVLAAHNRDYSDLLQAVRQQFLVNTVHAKFLFMTDVTGLNDLYLDNLPDLRQVHNCHCCRRFLDGYGRLVAINDDGSLTSILRPIVKTPEFYRHAFAVMSQRVEKSRVMGVHITDESIWGRPQDGYDGATMKPWSHMAIEVRSDLVGQHSKLHTPFQAMAATAHNFETVTNALTEFTKPMLDQAIKLLQAETLARSEKFLAPAQWLRQLHDRPRGRKGENLLWRAVAEAPEGFCHPKASVLGPLLDDIQNGVPFADLKKRFDAKLDALKYQRPQAAPTAGNVAAAEATVARLGIEPSLRRRFARLDELKTIWQAQGYQAPAPTGRVFGHLKTKDQIPSVPPVNLPMQTMTWVKFRAQILPLVRRMELLVPGHGNFIALTGPVHPEAPPILKWDRPDDRYPIAWYVWPGGSPASSWNLMGGSWHPITAISPLPPMAVSRPAPHLGEGDVLIIQGAVDNRNGGIALFPECLIEELHGVCATIEAHSRGASLSGRQEASACGYDMRKSNASCTLRIFTDSWSQVHIDRWD